MKTDPHEELLKLRARLNIIAFQNNGYSKSLASKKHELLKQNRSHKFFHSNDSILIYNAKGYVKCLNSLAFDKSNNEIYCRHLAAALISPNKRGIKNYQKAYESIENIEAIPELANNTFDNEKLLFKSSFYTMFNVNNFGQQLLKIAEVLQEHEETSLLFGSINHIMAITIMRKKTSLTESQYVIKFYDPNKTNIHTRIIVEKLNRIANLSIKDILGSEILNVYFPDRISILFAIKNAKTTNVEPLILVENGIEYKSLVYCLIYGFTPQVRSITQAILESNLTEKAKFNLLLAEDEIEVPAIFSAFKYKHLAAIKAYVETILNSQMQNAENIITKLLMAPNSNGSPILFLALEHGDYQVVKIYMEAILNSKFKDNAMALIPLLLANRKNGTTGLFMALQDGYFLAAKVYMEAILRLKFKDNDKALIMLLAANKSNNCPGLFMAMKFGRLESVQVYLETILHSDLNDEAIVKLLQAENAKGCSALFSALKNGHDKVVRYYINTIINSKLNPKAIKQLLLAQSEDGTSGLYMAMQGGNSIVVKVYLEAILSLKNKNNTLTRMLLLLSNSNYKISGLLAAIKNTFEVSITSNLPIALNDSYIMEILLAKNNNGVPGLIMAIQEGQDQVAKIYINTIINSNLAPASKIKLIFPENSSANCALFFQSSANISYVKNILLNLLAKSNTQDKEQLETIMQTRFSSVLGCGSV